MRDRISSEENGAKRRDRPQKKTDVIVANHVTLFTGIFRKVAVED